MDAWLGLVVLSVVGALIGTLTGLLPSFHTNTLAVLLLAAVPGLSLVLEALGFVGYAPAFFASALILAVSITHTFINIIPGAYLGAPDESAALNVLPAHKMLLRGQGYRAVRLSAYASFAALFVSLVLVFPFKWVFGPPNQLFEALKTVLPLILLGFAALLIWTEPHGVGPSAWDRTLLRAAGRMAAGILFVASGLFGLLIFRIEFSPWIEVPPSALLPALSGLFGGATILTSALGTAKIPHQFLRLADKDLRPSGAAIGFGIGVAAGATMSLLPGLTGASATGIVAAIRRGGDAETIVNLSAVNTANAVFNLAMLYLFLKTRSGAVVAIEAILPVEAWEGWPPHEFVLLLGVCLVSGIAALALTLFMGKSLVRKLQRVPYPKLLAGVFVYLLVSSLVFSGWTGLVVFLTGTALGILPVRIGVRRVVLTGVLLVPVLSYLWG